MEWNVWNVFSLHKPFLSLADNKYVCGGGESLYLFIFEKQKFSELGKAGFVISLKLLKPAFILSYTCIPLV